jgi:hypothetical protein
MLTLMRQSERIVKVKKARQAKEIRGYQTWLSTIGYSVRKGTPFIRSGLQPLILNCLYASISASVRGQEGCVRLRH